MKKKEPKWDKEWHDVMVSAKIPRDLHRRMKLEAIKQNLTLQVALKSALTLWLREMRAEK